MALPSGRCCHRHLGSVGSCWRRGEGRGVPKEQVPSPPPPSRSCSRVRWWRSAVGGAGRAQVGLQGPGPASQRAERWRCSRDTDLYPQVPRGETPECWGVAAGVTRAAPLRWAPQAAWLVQGHQGGVAELGPPLPGEGVWGGGQACVLLPWACAPPRSPARLPASRACSSLPVSAVMRSAVALVAQGRRGRGQVRSGDTGDAGRWAPGTPGRGQVRSEP